MLRLVTLLLTAAMTLLTPHPSIGQERYQVVETKNIHNHLKLDTATGKVWQIEDSGFKQALVSRSLGSGPPGRFRLYSTQNMWNFLLLDRQNGRVWQVQFSVDGNEGYWAVNNTSLGYGMYRLQPTQNIWKFILIDDGSGEMWRIQFSVNGDDDYRWIEKI